MDTPAIPFFYPWLQPIVDKFIYQENKQKLSHAWVFYGQSGSGKAALIKQMSKQILAPNERNKQQWIEDNTHPDFMMVAPNENGRIAIDAIRDAIIFLSNTPAAGTNKVVCLVQAEKMNRAAQSALLKTLEEPPGHAYLFLTTENVGQLLPTILSRCQKQAIGLPKPHELDAWLATQLSDVAPDILFLAKTLANDSPGLTLSLLSEMQNQSLPFLLYLVSIIASNWQVIPGLKAFVEKRLGLTLPDYIFSPKSISDRQLKIEFYRYVCRLREKVQSFSGINTKLLLHSLEQFDSSSKRIVW
jgi:hypothetical protein